MYATGLGLVLKGFEEFERKFKAEPRVQETTLKSEVAGHSEKEKRGSFFDKILPKVKGFFEDNDN